MKATAIIDKDEEGNIGIQIFEHEPKVYGGCKLSLYEIVLDEFNRGMEVFLDKDEKRKNDLVFLELVTHAFLSVIVDENTRIILSGVKEKISYENGWRIYKITGGGCPGFIIVDPDHKDGWQHVLRSSK